MKNMLKLSQERGTTMIDMQTALKGLRAAAPTVPSAAINGLDDLKHDFAPTILSSIECAAIVFGQLAHESLELTKLEENLNYSAEAIVRSWRGRFPTIADAQPYARNPEKLANKTYGGRMGNTDPGDGWRYRGSGYIQLTGRANFKAASKDLGIDFEAQPRLARTAIHGWRLADWFLRTTKVSGKPLIELAQDGKTDAVSRGINGGDHGLDDRRRRAELALDAMIEDTAPKALPTFDKSKTESVRALQQRLRHLGYAPGPIDGIWGPITKQAVMRFQTDAMHSADGDVGTKTRKALDEAIGV